MKTGQLRVSQAVYIQRKQRMQKLLILDAPNIIIRQEARLLCAAVHESWRSRFGRWRISHSPHWWLMLTHKDYRQADKDAKCEQTSTNSY